MLEHCADEFEGIMTLHDVEALCRHENGDILCAAVFLARVIPVLSDHLRCSFASSLRSPHFALKSFIFPCTAGISLFFLTEASNFSSFEGPFFERAPFSIHSRDLGHHKREDGIEASQGMCFSQQ